MHSVVLESTEIDIGTYMDHLHYATGDAGYCFVSKGKSKIRSTVFG